MPEYRIAKFYKGKFGYNNYYELQQWNTVYEHWYSITTGFLELEFVKNYCLIKSINYDNIPHVEIEKDNEQKAGKVIQCLSKFIIVDCDCS